MRENIKILQFIATGLVLWQKQYEEKKTFYPMPDILIRGINMLAARAIENEKEYPCNNNEVIEYFSKPILSWINLESNYFQDNDKLIENNQITDFCYEFSEYYFNSNVIDLENEIQQNLMLQVMNICHLEGDQQGYVNFRKKIIENRIININEVFEWSNDLNNSSAAKYFKDCYERIPAYAIKDHKVYQCKYCGWTIEWDNDLLPKCNTPLCQTFTNNFRKISEISEKPENLLRLNRGCMRFIAKPGKYEIALENKLKSLGLKVEMWPDFDKYDLKVIFPSGLVWAVDVKDYSNPFSLVQNIKPLSKDITFDKFFYIIPQYRYKFNKNYEKVFKANFQGSDNVQLLMEKRFIEKVKFQLGGNG